MAVQVRECSERDYSAIGRLFEQFQDLLIEMDPMRLLQHPPGYGATVLEATLADVAKRQGAFYLAEDDGIVVGFVVAVVYATAETLALDAEAIGVRPSTRGRIADLYVDVPYRRQGIGRLLMQKAERYLH